jgi:hypothetical protein
MNYIHSINIESLKTTFGELVTMCKDIYDKKEQLNNKLLILKQNYNELISTNNKKIFLFCLDSFYYQYKIYSIEMENISKFITILNNRMYGDYYKLYNIIILQFKEKNAEFAGIITAKKQLVYKDLEPNIEYNIDIIQEIHNDILQVIMNFHEYCLEKEKKITEYNNQSMYGFSITSFINTLEYENSIMREQITLYCNYIHFFHNIQRDNFARLYSKIIIFHNDIDENMNKTTKQLPNYASNTNISLKPLIIDDEIVSPTEANNNNNNNNNDLFYDNMVINEYSNKSIQDLSNVFIFPDENNPFSQFSSFNPLPEQTQNRGLFR